MSLPAPDGYGEKGSFRVGGGSVRRSVKPLNAQVCPVGGLESFLLQSRFAYSDNEKPG